MKIDTTTKEGRKLAMIYMIVKNGVSKDFEPYDFKKDIYNDGPVAGLTPEEAYREGIEQINYDIKLLIELKEFECKKVG